MNGYPPGITGREFQIAGPDAAWVEERDCDAELFNDNGETDGWCYFTGEVDLQSYGADEWWTCPDCGTEHTVTIEAGDDL